MNQSPTSDRYHPTHQLRIVTAASLFDGHDAAINIMRRLIQDGGAEVIHLGHNRSVADIVKAEVEEDAHAIAISSYQGGHNEFFRYMFDLLKENGAGHVKIFGGGGGVIIPEEIEALHDYGITRIYSPEDGRRLGLVGMIDHMLETADRDLLRDACVDLDAIKSGDRGSLARLISLLETESGASRLGDDWPGTPSNEDSLAPVVGITGTGGAGKSSFTDELLNRYLADFESHRVAVLSVDPTRRRTGGALLGDRIRMNQARHERVFMRSLATRAANAELSGGITGAIQACRLAGYDLIVVETSGIGQGSSSIVDISDIHIYVMTPEYGAPSQLEKIDMLDLADLIVVNKFDRRGAEDALRDVRKQVRRNRQLFHSADSDLPVFGAISARFSDDGVNGAYSFLLDLLRSHTGAVYAPKRTLRSALQSSDQTAIVPPSRLHYLGEIASTVRDYHA